MCAPDDCTRSKGQVVEENFRRPGGGRCGRGGGSPKYDEHGGHAKMVELCQGCGGSEPRQLPRWRRGARSDSGKQGRLPRRWEGSGRGAAGVVRRRERGRNGGTGHGRPGEECRDAVWGGAAVDCRSEEGGGQYLNSHRLLRSSFKIRL